MTQCVREPHECPVVKRPKYRIAGGLFEFLPSKKAAKLLGLKVYYDN